MPKINMSDNAIQRITEHELFKLNWEMLEQEARNLFEWTGPEMIPFKIMERDLINLGHVVMFNHDVYGLMVAPCTITEFDRYKRPTIAQVNINTTVNAIHEVLYLVYDDNFIPESKFGVLIKNNLEATSLKPLIKHYCELLTMLDLSMRVNLLWQNLPPIFSVEDEASKLSYEKLISDIFNAEPFILLDKLMMRPDKGRALYESIDVPFKFNDLQKAKEQLINNYRTKLGILSAGTTKESGVAQNELTLNSQALDINLSEMLSAREESIHLIQKYFNIALTVKVKGQEEREEEQDGSSDDRVEEPTEN